MPGADPGICVRGVHSPATFSLPSSSFPITFFLSSPPCLPFPLEVGHLKPARGSGACCKLPSEVRDRAPAENEFVAHALLCSVDKLVHSCAMVRLISSSLLPVHCTCMPSWTKESAMSTRLPATSAVGSEWADVAWIFVFYQCLSQSKSLSRLRRLEAERRESQPVEQPTPSA